MISEAEIVRYQQYYDTPAERFHLLPPGIARLHVVDTDSAKVRAGCRQQFDLCDTDYMVLLVGSGFRTKGVDRAIKAVAALPDAIKHRTHFMVAGSDKPGSFQRLASRLNIQSRVHFLGGRNDVPPFIAGRGCADSSCLS